MGSTDQDETARDIQVWSGEDPRTQTGPSTATKISPAPASHRRRLIRLPAFAPRLPDLTERREKVRTWATRPAGRLVGTGLVITGMLAGAGVAGAFIAPQTVPSAQTRPGPEPTAPAQGDQPSADPAPPLPTESVGVPSSTPRAGRPADAYAGWALPLSSKLDIPSVVLEAYAYAELVASQRTPNCKLSWTLLAGIGKIESNHGRAKGSQMRPDGKSTPGIVGAPLDGQSGRKAIPDTDAGRYDGDRSWDRAVGPMQFIPTTWQRYAVDGDGDSATDPNDIDDAALAAAEYLCAGGRDLSTPDGWYGAVQSYNAPESYQQNVFAAADDYGRRSRS